ncbi:HNH endonuclease [Variovorax ginsengisoli]|uniref:HNH endonuclease n=2 Tax=Variovorax guangxiensis TaxID=1775474 RepID=A0A502DZP1_9BURK|nr:HNH endonuclease [Variovorax ginsengisoli]TPG30797.1 HNH endonuclease [Variovorax guangxiensis]
MMRLNDPERDFSATLDECIEGILGNNAFKAKMVAAKPDLLQAGANYIIAGNSGALFSIPPSANEKEKDTVILGNLTKAELVNLYEYYFRNEEKASRTTYDKLLNSAQEQCPFCGGIGTPRNLDHFLPKSRFPQFSTFPKNLVPSCRDCNMDGKAESFATRAEDQLIHPYVDHDRFFNKQWIFAKCLLDPSNRPISVHYFVASPDEWEQVNKDRAQKHFHDFGLAKRYSVKAAQLLETTLAQIAGLKKLGLSNAAICTSIISPGIDKAPFINHWQKGMFQAIYATLQN